MILRDHPPTTPLTPCACGQAPRLIEARGRVGMDPRLLGKPARQYHVECAPCGLATRPVYSVRTAEALWRLRDQAELIPIANLPAERLHAEEFLARTPVFVAA
jgi:hypothetical protein